MTMSIETVTERLNSFGYETTSEDEFNISFCIQKVENHIKNFCNISEIPDELFHVELDMICGEFLYTLKQIGKLSLNDLDLNAVVTQITEGDTSVRFGEGSSSEEKLSEFIDYLRSGNEGDLICYRKLKW